jgi:hypothetical protein
MCRETELEARFLTCVRAHRQAQAFPEDDELDPYQTRWVAACRCGWNSVPLDHAYGIAASAWQSHLAAELVKVVLQYDEKKST